MSRRFQSGLAARCNLFYDHVLMIKTSDPHSDQLSKEETGELFFINSDWPVVDEPQVLLADVVIHMACICPVCPTHVTGAGTTSKLSLMGMCFYLNRAVYVCRRCRW